MTVANLEGDPRPIIPATAAGSDGRTRTGRFLVDTGGGAVLVSDRLARELRLPLGRRNKTADGTFAGVKPLFVTVGGRVITHSQRSFAVVGSEELGGAEKGYGLEFDGVLPRDVLRKHDVAFDFAARQVSFADQGEMRLAGRQVDVDIDRSGFVTTALRAGGTNIPVFLDTGSILTCVDAPYLKELAAAHPTWRRVAYPQSGLCGGPEAAIVVPDLTWDGIALGNQTLYPLSGSGNGKRRSGVLGASSLAGLRVQIDYRDKRVSVSRPTVNTTGPTP